MRRLSGGALACLVLLGAARSDAVTVVGAVTVAGRPATDAVVYLESAGTPASPPATGARAIMDQKDLEFVPKVLPVVRGTTVEFTNGDDIQHNVFSPSTVAGKFDLGSYGPGAVRSIVLRETGEVLVLCNIHMEMEAHILVFRDPYFAATANDGTYRITDVPPGTYAVRLWREHFSPEQRVVDVPPSGEFTLNVQFPN